MKLNVYLFLLFLYFSSIYRAEAQIDSLKKQLQIIEKTPNSLHRDTSLSLILDKLSAYYTRIEADTAIIYSEKALKIAQNADWEIGIYQSYINLGNIYLQRNDYSLALEYYLKSLAVAEQMSYGLGVAISLNNSGIVYQEQKMYPEAISYYQQAFRKFEQLGRKGGMAVALTGMAEVYKFQKDFKKALEYNLKVLNIREKANSKVGIAIASHNIGEVYGELGEFKKSLDYLFKGLKIDEELHLKYEVITDNNVIAKVLYKSKQYSQSILYAQKALEPAQKAHLKDEIKNAAETLYLNHKMLNDNTNALKFHELFDSYEDSLFNQENILKISNLEKNFALSKKQHELEVFQKENEKQKLQQNLIVAILAIVLLVAIILVVYLRNKNQIRQLKHDEKLAEIAFLNSHQTRAPLATLLGLLSVIDKEKIQDEENLKIIEMIKQAAKKLDEVIHQIGRKTNPE